MVTSKKELKKQILAAKTSTVRGLNREKILERELSKLFKHIKENVLKELYAHYNEEFMFQAHADLILSPIFESQQEYYNLLELFNRIEYKEGRKEARRLVKLARQKARHWKIADKSEYTKINPRDLINAEISTDNLFGTHKYSEETLLNRSFTASEHTMNRVDSDISKILHNGYQNGLGVDEVAKDIETRFNQLSTWESRRIARTELHGAHNIGTMQQYGLLGVEYTQWISARDTRTRDSHVEINGEIIPFGGTYSNGLSYPGDTSGSIKEWINCRCSHAPFIIPDGYIAPNFSPFREEDLIATLDLYNQEELINQAIYADVNRNAMLYDVPIKESLIENKFAVVTEDLSDFGISKRGLRTIQQVQKRNFGEAKEYGFRFDKKTGKLLSDEFEGNGNNVTIPPSRRGAYSTIHNHTDDGLSPLSAEDLYTYFMNRREDVGINVSRHETWLIKMDRAQFTEEDVIELCNKIYEKEVIQIRKLNDEYDLLKKEIDKGIKTKAEVDKYLANDFVLKHNKECGDEVLKVLSGKPGLKVKRVKNNTNVQPVKIKDLKNIKTVKPNRNSKYTRKSPQIKGYNKYSLTESEQLRYEELKALKEKEGKLRLKKRREFEMLADRKEFNEMWNEVLLHGGDPTDIFAFDEIDYGRTVRYEKLFKKFKDWVPKGEIEVKPIKIKTENLHGNKDAFKLTSDEQKVRKQLKENFVTLSDDEKRYKGLLDDKERLNRYHNLLSEGKLDHLDTDNYVKLYSKYKKEWSLPELTPDLKLAVDKPTYTNSELYKNIKEFGLSKTESDDLYYLKKKELLGQKLSSKEVKRMEFLEAKDEFAYLNSVRTNGGGLDYKEHVQFKKLYKQLKTELKLDKSVLEPYVPHYKSEIPLDKNPQNLKKFKGTTEDGLLPNGEDLTKYFTKDAREMNPREYQVSQRWLGPDYKAFTNFEVDCGRDVKKFEKWIYDMAKAYEKDNSLKYYEYYYKECLNPLTGRINKKYATELSRSIAHDVPVLDDILNNQLKEGMVLWRVQEHHNLESTVVGAIMDLPNFRSTAISKEGALFFSATNKKEMKYILMIDAPAGTKGAYLAPIKEGTWWAPPGQEFDHPMHGKNYAREMELLLKKCKVELVQFGGKPYKGALGEDLIPIKLRVVGY